MLNNYLEIKAGATYSWTLQFTNTDAWDQTSGTVTVTQGNATVTGSSTAFLSEYYSGMPILIDGNQYEVNSITSNTILLLTTPSKSNSSAVPVYHPDVADITGKTILFAIKKKTDLNILDAADANAIYTASLSSHISATLGITVLTILNTASIAFLPDEYYWELKDNTTKQVTDTGIFKVLSRTVNQR